jgi:Flp pilus assembly protein TadG
VTRGDTGSAAVELAVLAPVLVALLLLVVLAGRISDADIAIRHAAADAARAASLTRTPAAANRAATETVADNLAATGLTCRQLETTVDTATFAPGGRVAVTVECTVDLQAVSLLAIPGSRTLRADGIEVVDRYRAGSGT